jgi:hypothetical protein
MMCSQTVAGAAPWVCGAARHQGLWKPAALMRNVAAWMRMVAALPVVVAL